MKNAILLLFFSCCFLTLFGQANVEFNENPKVNTLLEIAYSKMGCEYISGAMGPNVFDCSGFTQYLYKQINIEIPRTAREQYYYKKGKIIETQNIRKGDLIFFISDKDEETKIGHVALAYTDYSNGDFQFIHSRSTRGVCIDKYSENFYNKIYSGARRIIRDEKKPTPVNPVLSENLDTITDSETYEENQDSLWVDQSVPEFPEDENPFYYYTVKGTQTIFDVSRKFMVSVENIRQWNSLKSNKLYKGQRLKIYSSVF